MSLYKDSVSLFMSGSLSPCPCGSFPGREATESTVSQQLSLSVGDDSLGSWSNLSFEDEHPDETSSFLHLSDR